MSETQKLREALQLIAWSNDSKWQVDCARQALALPTADHLPEAGKMINGLTQAETDASASVSGLTAAPAPAITYDQWQQHEYTKVLQDRIKELSEKLAIYTQALAPAQEFNKSVADADIKALYVESQGSDKGWLGIEGSYFIGGVVAARKQKAAKIKELIDAKA
jgi:hypothetical protein